MIKVNVTGGSLTQEGNYRTAIITYGITLLVTAASAAGYRAVHRKKGAAER